MNWPAVSCFLLGGIFLLLVDIRATLRANFHILSRWEQRREKSGQP
jgi:hypothetical protein